MVRISSADTIQYRTNLATVNIDNPLEGDWESYSPLRPRRQAPSESPPPCYPGQLYDAKFLRKRSDFMRLVDFIPPPYCQFYMNLPAQPTVRKVGKQYIAVQSQSAAPMSMDIDRPSS
jgi:hypothetical protein